MKIKYEIRINYGYRNSRGQEIMVLNFYKKIRFGFWLWSCIEAAYELPKLIERAAEHAKHFNDDEAPLIWQSEIEVK